MQLKDNSGRLDTRYSLTIIMQLYTYVKADAHLIGWQSSSGWGPFIRILGQTIHYRLDDDGDNDHDDIKDDDDDYDDDD